MAIEIERRKTKDEKPAPSEAKGRNTEVIRQSSFVVGQLVSAYRALIKLVEWTLIAAVLLLAFIVPVGVIFRYALNAALSWTDEVGGMLLVFITFLGSVVALDRGGHLDMDLFANRTPPRLRLVLRAFIDLVLAVWLVVILINGWTIATRLFGQTLVSLPISRGLLQGVMPLSAMLMLIVLAARWFLPGATTWDRKRADTLKEQSAGDRTE